MLLRRPARQLTRREAERRGLDLALLASSAPEPPDFFKRFVSHTISHSLDEYLVA